MEQFTPKWEIQTLSTCPHGWWKGRGSFVVHKTFLEFHSKTALQNNQHNSSLLKPWDPKLIWKYIIQTLDAQANSCTHLRWWWDFSSAATLKILTENVKITSFQINFGSRGFWRLGVLQHCFTLKLQKCFCGLIKNFIWLCISIRLSRQWLNFPFWVNLSFIPHKSKKKNT